MRISRNIDGSSYLEQVATVNFAIYERERLDGLNEARLEHLMDSAVHTAFCHNEPLRDSVYSNDSQIPPSTLGKRKHIEFDSDLEKHNPAQPSMTSTPVKSILRRCGQQHVMPELPRRDNPYFTRRIVAHVVSLYGIIATIWGWLRPRTQILAVETSPEGNKRRAVEIFADRTSEMPQAAPTSLPIVPGQFPSPQLTPEESLPPMVNITEPVANAATQDSAQQTEPARKAESSQQAGCAIGLTPPGSRPGSAQEEWRKQEQRPTFTETRGSDGYCRDGKGSLVTGSKNRIYTYKQWLEAEGRNADGKLKTVVQKAQQKTPPPSPPPRPVQRRYTVLPADARAAYTASTSRYGRSPEQRDAIIDGLTARAQKVKLGSPTEQDAWESYRRRKEQERERQAAEERAAEASRLAELAKLKAHAEEKARLKAQVEEEAKLKAEGEIAGQTRRALAHVPAGKEQLMRPLDDEENIKVDKAMAVKDKNKVLATSCEGTDLTRYDFGRLVPTGDKEADGSGPSGWLNDETVNAWFQSIVKRKKQQTGYVKSAKTVPAYEAYNSLWYNNYKKKDDIKTIKAWSRRKGIQGDKLLQAEKIYFPINTGAHWSLLIISPVERKLEYLDSVPQRPKRAFQIAREWLEMELGDKYIAEEWKESSVKSTQQTNCDDCGVFICFNGLASAKGRDFREVRAEMMKSGRRMIAAILLNGGFSGEWEL